MHHFMHILVLRYGMPFLFPMFLESHSAQVYQAGLLQIKLWNERLKSISRDLLKYLMQNQCSSYG
jgi:hypothetical protein